MMAGSQRHITNGLRGLTHSWNSPRGLHVSPFPRRPAAFTPWNPARQASTHRKLTSSANSNRKHHPSKPTELGDGFDSGTDTGTNGQPQRPPAKRQRKNGDVSKRGRPRKGVQLLPGPAPIPLAIEKKKEAVRAPSPKPVPVEAPTPPVRKDKEHKKEPKKEPEPPRAPTPEEEYMGRPFPAFNPVLAKFPNYSWWIAVPLRPSTAPPWTQGRHSLTATLSDPAGRPYLVKSIPTGGDHRWALPSELRALDDSLIEQILTERYEEVPPRSWVKWRGELLEAIGIATNPTR